MSRCTQPVILTVGGNYFDLMDPERTRHVVNLTDIGHALAHICRYTGHCQDFYSVAQHSVLCYHEARELYPDDKFLQVCALLHDAAEAYTNDITSPMKMLLPDYRQLESRIEAVVYSVLGMPMLLPSEVKRIDLVLLATEKRDIMPACGDWDMLKGIAPRERKIHPWSPGMARHMFYASCRELGMNVPERKRQ